MVDEMAPVATATQMRRLLEATRAAGNKERERLGLAPVLGRPGLPVLKDTEGQLRAIGVGYPDAAGEAVAEIARKAKTKLKGSVFCRSFVHTVTADTFLRRALDRTSLVDPKPKKVTILPPLLARSTEDETVLFTRRGDRFVLTRGGTSDLVIQMHERGPIVVLVRSNLVSQVVSTLTKLYALEGRFTRAQLMRALSNSDRRPRYDR